MTHNIELKTVLKEGQITSKLPDFEIESVEIFWSIEITHTEDAIYTPQVLINKIVMETFDALLQEYFCVKIEWNYQIPPPHGSSWDWLWNQADDGDLNLQIESIFVDSQKRMIVINGGEQ